MIGNHVKYALLKGREVKTVNTSTKEGLLTWINWFEKTDRHIVPITKIDDVEVSTVFLGIDHGLFSPPPVWFETMIFGGEHDGYCERYSTYEEAEQGHQRIVECLKKGVAP